MIIALLAIVAPWDMSLTGILTQKIANAENRVRSLIYDPLAAIPAALH
jgi:hypothetical protein